MARSPDTLICVFAKEPQAGAVKTRLIPLLGPQGAADFHARCVRHALKTALDADLGPVVVCCSPDSGADFFARCAVACSEQERLGSRTRGLDQILPLLPSGFGTRRSNAHSPNRRERRDIDKVAAEIDRGDDRDWVASADLLN